MTLDEFIAALARPEPPAGLAAPLLGLWHDGRGDWDAAHRAVQDDPGKAAAWVHALLHRKEGDDANAGYWYGRAGKPRFTGAFEAEWRAMAAELLGCAAEPPSRK